MTYLIVIVAIVFLIVLIWLMIEFKRMRHKTFAFFLIFLILFLFFSFAFVFSEKNVDYKTGSGIIEAGKIYLSWLGTLFNNLKSITTNAIKMDWKGNESG